MSADQPSKFRWPRLGLPGGLAARQVRLTLVVALVTGLLMATVQILLDYHNTRENISRQLQQVLESTTPAAAESVWTLNTDLANGVIEGLLRHPAIVEAHIETVTGTLLGSQARSLEGGAEQGWSGFLFGAPTKEVRQLSHPGDTSANTIGVLWLKVDPIEVRREFLGRVVIIAVSGLVKALLLSGILLALFYVTLTRPIQRYAGWIATIEPESPERWSLHPPKRIQQDELAALGDSVAQRFREARHYFLQLQQTRSDLKVLNAQLEQRVQQRTRELSAALARAEQLASTDELTGIPNRRCFMQRAEQRHAEWLRHRKPYALLMLDIDHFKQINDRYGHPAGDQVLRSVAEVLELHTRHEDTLGRLGGEEFCVLLVESVSSDAQRLAERMRQALAELEIEVGGQIVSITASFGLVWCETGTDDSFETLLQAADDALYQAKHQGRNQLCLHRSLG